MAASPALPTTAFACRNQRRNKEMSKYSNCPEAGVPVDIEAVCRFFERIPESLIEEPEVCEWCEFFEDGKCFHGVKA